MKQITIFFGLLLLVSANSFAQTADQRNSPQQAIYIESFGQGKYFYTINYDTRFTKSVKGIGGRIGAGYFPWFPASITTVAGGVNYLIGNKGKYLEIGTGLTYIYIHDFALASLFGTETPISAVIGTGSVGFRYQPEAGGFNFRFAFTPTFNSSFDLGSPITYLGLSLGYTFKDRKAK